MGKHDTKEALADTKAARDQSQQNYNAAITGSNTVQTGLSDAAAAEKGSLSGQYSSLGANVTPLNFAPISTRNIDTSALSSALGNEKDFAATGGFTPDREASIMSNVNNLKNIAQTGGITDENAARIRGNGGFDEFATTGGYTAPQIANIKAQALSPISSYATATRDELARKAAVSGGYAPGFDAANRQLQRDTSRNIADTSLNANVAIQDKINAGRQWGISGLSGAESNLAGLVSGNKIAASTDAGNLELNLQSTISQYRAMGLSMEQATAKALADFDAQNVANENSVSMFNSNGLTNASQFNIQNQQAQQAAGIAGLQGIYNTDVGQVQNERDRANALLGGQTQSNLGYLNTQSGLATQPGVGGLIAQGVGSAAGAGVGLLAPVVRSRPQ